MKGKDGGEEAAAAEKQFAELGVTVADCMHLKLPLCGDDRYLVVMKKINAENAG
jgi:hypothetical protein